MKIRFTYDNGIELEHILDEFRGLNDHGCEDGYIFSLELKAMQDELKLYIDKLLANAEEWK